MLLFRIIFSWTVIIVLSGRKLFQLWHTIFRIIEILGYLKHSDPIQIFKIFNQRGKINKGLICKPLFYKVWYIYWYHFWYYGAHKWGRLGIPVCDEHTSKTFGRNFYTMCHQVLVEVLDLKIVYCNFLSAFLLAWMGADPFSSCGGFKGHPTCTGGSLYLYTPTLRMGQHSKLLQNAPHCHRVQKPQYMFRTFACTYDFAIMQCYTFYLIMYVVFEHL